MPKNSPIEDEKLATRFWPKSAILDPAFEALAEEGLSEELKEWPEY